MSEPQPPLEPRRTTGAIGCFIILVLAALTWAAFRFGWVAVPPNTLPWQRAVLDAEPGRFAHWQIQRLLRDRAVCRTALDHARLLEYHALADKTIDSRCGFIDVVRADKTPISFNIQPTTTCGLAAALYWWQRDVQRIAQSELGTRIARIDQVGTFACRNVNSEPTGSRSEHATANAIDIEDFRAADGRRISVLHDWGKPTSEGRFLRAVHDSACRYFGDVLGPDYNRLHAAHFHLDEAAWTLCR